MIQDPNLMAAVSRIMQRAERQVEIDKLLDTFVDVGLSTQLRNNNNQIIYGRRGTGKTHIFRVVADNIGTDKKNVVIYIDMRILGSAAQYTDPSIPIPERCRLLFSDFIKQVSDHFLEHIATHGGEGLEKAWTALSDLSMIPVEARKVRHSEEIVEKSVSEEQKGTDIRAKIDIKSGVGAEARLKHKDATGIERQRSYKKQPEASVVFPDLKGKVEEILDSLSSTLYLFMDEWSSLPLDVQPYFAEMLKRSLLPMPQVVIKIASLEYRSRFNNQINGRTYGFELGADIATTVDIDDYYVYDRNPEVITEVFSTILFKHLNSELKENYLRVNHSIQNAADLISHLFTSSDVFKEAVRAAEGVVRDLINIFSSAYFDSQRKGRDSIDRLSILEAARQWFEKDKANNLNEELQSILERIVNQVIGGRKARSFMLPRELERNLFIQQLFDFRIIHLVKRGYADKENPGSRYNIYTLDYGTYVDLLNTSKQPELDFVVQEKPAKDFVVPFDDKRSIRRIILKESDLKQK